MRWLILVAVTGCATAPKATVDFCGAPDIIETTRAEVEFDVTFNCDAGSTPLVIRDLPDGVLGIALTHEIRIDPEAWSYDPELVVAHEVGHSLGYEHDDSDPCGTMRTYYWSCPTATGP